MYHTFLLDKGQEVIAQQTLSSTGTEHLPYITHLLYTENPMLTMFPPTTDTSIKPTDRADTYLIETVTDSLGSAESTSKSCDTNRAHAPNSQATPVCNPQTTPNLLVVNDRYGALHCGLDSYVVCGIQDSYNGQKSIRHNLQTMGQPTPTLITTLDLHTPNQQTTQNLQSITGVIMKIPKGLDFFKFQLKLLAESLPEGTQIWAGGMVKYLPKSFFTTFAKHTSHAKYTLAQGKARLYIGKLQKPYKIPQGDGLHKNTYINIPANESPSTTASPNATASPAATAEPSPAGTPTPYATYPGVFSHKKLDRGTNFLLQHFPRLPKPPKTVVDIGCGAGILLTKAHHTWPKATLIGTDDSALAIAASAETAKLNGYDATLLHTHIADGLHGGTADLVLCNPPFHQDHRVAMDLGASFIAEAARLLATGHEKPPQTTPSPLATKTTSKTFALVTNKHLGYEKLLRKHFKRTTIIAQNKQFRVYLSSM